MKRDYKQLLKQLKARRDPAGVEEPIDYVSLYKNAKNKLYYFEGRNTGVVASSAAEAKKNKSQGGDKIVAVREMTDAERKQGLAGKWIRTRRDGKSPNKSEYGKGQGYGPPRGKKKKAEIPTAPQDSLMLDWYRNRDVGLDSMRKLYESIDKSPEFANPIGRQGIGRLGHKLFGLPFASDEISIGDPKDLEVMSGIGRKIMNYKRNLDDVSKNNIKDFLKTTGEKPVEGLDLLYNLFSSTTPTSSSVG